MQPASVLSRSGHPSPAAAMIFHSADILLVVEGQLYVPGFRRLPYRARTRPRVTGLWEQADSHIWCCDADISLVVEGQLYVPGSRRLHYGGQDVTEKLRSLLSTGQDIKALRVGELERLKHKSMHLPALAVPLPGVSQLVLLIRRASNLADELLE